MGLSDVGGAVTWGETRDLIEQAAADGSTYLGAELAGWAYPASTLGLLTLIATVGDPKSSRPLMPWVMKNPREERPSSTPDEIAAAEAALEAEFVFT